MDGRPEKRQQWRRRRGAGLCGLAVAALAALACQAAAPASAMTEHCMLDGDDVKSSVFVAPTTETAPVRIVMKGVVYAIPRNYFSYPQAECRTGETRGVLLRMTLPDMQPATEANWDSLYGATAARDDQYIVLSTDQNISQISTLLSNFRLDEVVGPVVPSIAGFESFARGPIYDEKKYVWDVYHTDKPTKFVMICNPKYQTAKSSCKIYFMINGATWYAWTDRKNIENWPIIHKALEQIIFSFVVEKGG